MASEESHPFDGASPPAFTGNLNDEDFGDLLNARVHSTVPDMNMHDDEEGLFLSPTPPPSDSRLDEQVLDELNEEEQQNTEPTRYDTDSQETKRGDISTSENINAKADQTIKESFSTENTVQQLKLETDEMPLIRPSSDQNQEIVRGQSAPKAVDTPLESIEEIVRRQLPGEISSAGPKIKPEPEDAPFAPWKPMPQGTIVISDRDDEEDIVMLEDESEVAIKKEPLNDDVQYLWTDMRCNGVIDLSDDGPEGERRQDAAVDVTTRPTPQQQRPDQDTIGVPVKKEPSNDEIQYLWTDMGHNGVIDLSGDEPAGEKHKDATVDVTTAPIPQQQRPAKDIGRMQQIQRMFAERALGRPVRANKMFSLPNRTQARQPTLSGDGFEWMANDVIPDENPAVEFRALKKAYKAKKAARKATLADDVAFRRAQIAENDRVRRDENDMSDDSKAEESDDGLFVPQGPSEKESSKRPFADLDTEDEALASALTGKPSSKKKQTAEEKEEAADRRARAKDYQKHLDKELRANMLAGIEATLFRERMKHELKISKIIEAEDAKHGKKKGSQKRKPENTMDLSPKRTKTGRMSNISSLVSGNIYEDSNMNLEKAVLPVISEKKKKEFMTELLASVPLEEKKQANKDRIDIITASRILGSRKVKPDGKGDWSFKGMKSSLYHYQVQGAAAMKSREKGTRQPHGGILADQMGLGKTVVTIATMISNRQTNPDRSKCTLIVCSPPLMTQWERELELHADEDMFKRIKRHHAGDKCSGKGAAEEMEAADILLTTYGEVVRSYPKCNIPTDFKTNAEKEIWWQKEWEEHRGLLHRAHFYRVVLDEAQAIKNHTSQTSVACRALMANHRWAISGTPIQNRLEEMFPYFKFLRLNHTGSMAIFKHNFCLKDNKVCMKRLVSIVHGLMIRRSHTDMLMGAPLMKLPKNTQVTINLKFTDLEQSLYNMIRLRCVRAINAASKEDRLEEKSVIIMFQRLRMMVSHIFMAQEVLEKEFEASNVEAIEQRILGQDPEASDLEKHMIENLKRMIQEKGQTPDFPEPEHRLFTNVEEQDPAPAVPKVNKKASTLVARFGARLRDLKKASRWSELRDLTVCQKCGENPEEPWVTSCYHLYCKECLENIAMEASINDLDQTECDKCGHVFTESQPCDNMKELEVRDLSVTIFQDESKKEPTEKKKFKLTMNYVDFNDKVLLSTKLVAVKNQVAAWIREDPKRKIIIFTEWLMVMHLMGRVCQQEGWKSCHYNGKMSHKSRDRALNEFQDEKSNLQVMVASLKCGGTGLNLTAASKVICVDLWFNSCVEQQAFARVHRIGQTQETYITRFTIENTIDVRLLEMQEEKKELIGAAMDDRSILSQLTLPELLRLFGEVAYDENSKPFILVDDHTTVRAKKGRKSGGSGQGGQA